MTGTVLARHRREAREFTTMLTQAQRTAVAVTLFAHPAARAEPAAAAAIAAAYGFPVSDAEPARGLAAALAHYLKG